MKSGLVFLLIAATAFQGAYSANTCFLKAAQATYDAGVAASACTGTDKCFDSVKVKEDGTKSYEKGCKACAADINGWSADNKEWEKMTCCNGDGENAGTADCNSNDMSATADLGPKCWKCDGTDSECEKGGDTETAGKYDKDTAVCDALTSMCFVERMAENKIKRGCAAACTDASEPGKDTFKKCCLSGELCNSIDATVGAGGGGGDSGAQVAFISYALLFSALLVAYFQ